MKYSITFAATFSLLMLLSPAIAQPSSNSQENPYGYQRFTPSMAIIIVVLIAALFFVAFFSIYIRQCSVPSGSAVGAAGNAAAGRSRRAARGIDAAVIATFPTMEYSEVKGHKIGKGALECAVCICEFEDHETLRLLPKCDHVFHPECIDMWLASHTTCPVCRANLLPNDPADLAGPEPTVEVDVEAQTQAQPEPEPEPVLSRNQTRVGSTRFKRLFPRSHSTGHSLIQPGENTERFTLKLPVEVRKEMVSRQLKRTSSMVVLPRAGSSRRGYRTTTTTGEGSSRGKRRLDRMFSMAPPFFGRMLSMKSPKVAANKDNDGASGSSSDPIVGPDVPRSDSSRPPV